MVKDEVVVASKTQVIKREDCSMNEDQKWHYQQDDEAIENEFHQSPDYTELEDDENYMQQDDIMLNNDEGKKDDDENNTMDERNRR